MFLWKDENHRLSSQSILAIGFSLGNRSAHGLTGKGLRLEVTVLNYKCPVNEQELHSNARLIRPLVCRAVLYGRRIEDDDVCVHPHLEPPLFLHLRSYLLEIFRREVRGLGNRIGPTDEFTLAHIL